MTGLRTGPRLSAIDDPTARRLAGSGTPCFGYRLDLARERFRRLRSVLPARVVLAYAVKSNPGAPLLEAFAAEGAWFDCASAGEVAAVSRARAGRAGEVTTTTGAGADQSGGQNPGHNHEQKAFRADKVTNILSGVVLAGPGKSVDDLRAGLAAGARIQVDGIEDVAWLDAHGDGGEPLPVSVRVHPATGFAEANPIIGGAGPAAFGVDEEHLADFVAQAAAYPRVRLAGLQVFAASNELDAGALLANHRAALEIGRRLQTELGIELDLIDLGGGLGIPYAPDEPELDIDTLGAGLQALIEDHDWFTGRLLLEPGRWLSGPTGVYLTTVTRVKRSRGTTFAVLAGGINHLLRPLLTGQPFPVRRVGDTDHESLADDVPTDRFVLTGPLCTSLDRLGTVELPADLAPGDLLAFGQAGAYAFTQAMTHFLSHPVPEQHWLDA